MASQRSSHGGLGSQNHHLIVAPAQVATTFPCFPHLHVELQDNIWEHAYPALETVPGVLFFRLNVVQTSEGRVMCFTPDAHAQVSTRGYRDLLGTCYRTRQKALKYLDILTLLDIDRSSGAGTEIRIPFSFEKTCFCIDGWEGHGIDAGSLGKLSGMDFAKKIKRIAFVHRDIDMLPYDSYKLQFSEFFQEVQCLGLLFHNAVQFGGIGRSALTIRPFLKQEAFVSLLFLQSVTQKRMVEGFLMTKPYSERCRIFMNAMQLVFGDWTRRIRDAIRRDDPRLRGALATIILAYIEGSVSSGVLDREALAELQLHEDTIDLLMAKTVAIN